MGIIMTMGDLYVLKSVTPILIMGVIMAMGDLYVLKSYCMGIIMAMGDLYVIKSCPYTDHG